MNICDRCYAKNGSSVRATGEVLLTMSEEAFDLCHTCMSDLKEFIDNPPKEKKVGRKRTRKTVDNS